MNALYSLFFVFALVLIPLIGVGAAKLNVFFGICIPSTALLVFLAGFVCKVYGWAKRPVPFRIPTTGGQQEPYDPTLFKQNKWDNPSTGPQTFMRMLLEVLCFRSLFRNTAVKLDVKNNVVAYASSKWLWLFAIFFHYSFFIIVARHMRLFLASVPLPIEWLEFGDGIMQIGLPPMYMSDVIILAGLFFLLARRLADPKIRYISLVNDFFPLFLLLGISLSGIYMRYFAKVDVVAIKELVVSALQFNYKIPAGIDNSFYVHLFLVSVLLAYFPFSKLMHAGGVFLSPTRNLPNDTRMKHHENPWNDKGIMPHSYEHYEDDFREPMYEAGLPLEKLPEGAEEEAKA